MKGEHRSIFQGMIQEKVDVVVGVVDKAEGGDTAGFEPEVLPHSFRGGERQFAGSGESLCRKRCLETLLEEVDIEILLAGKADEVVLVAFMVAQEDVFTVQGTVVAPPAACFFNGFSFGVGVAGEGNIVRVEVVEYNF